MTRTVEDYLEKYAQEKAASTWFQLKATQDNLAVLGKTAQKIIDNYDEIKANPALFEVSIFKTNLHETRGALSGAATDNVDALIPPPLVNNPQAQETLSVSALLNLSIDAVYESNNNNAFIYFVGGPDAPVTRAYPNIQLAKNLDNLDMLFWKDYFPQNIAGWQKWYADPALQARIPSPITVEPPYADAAGQGVVMTMFYPLWNHKTDSFAGVVAADITLNKIIEDILSTRVADTGFAFLMNSAGEIIAMPEAGFKLFDVNLEEVKQGNLTYYFGSLADSKNPAVRRMAAEALVNPEQVYRFSLSENKTEDESGNGYLAVLASLPPLSTNQYQEDSWKIVIVVPEAETYQVLYETDAAIKKKSAAISVISLALALGLLIVAVAVSTRFSNGVTRDLKTLALAAEQVSAKNYNIELRLNSQDEIGQLGRAFESMTREIRDYTVNLESKVLERTADLQRANKKITLLNARLKDENVRLSAELDVARQLQLMVLPPDSDIQAIKDLDIACYMRPADEVGGDYYDVLQVGDSIFISIGDVTGHGLPAGVIMLMAQTAFLTLSQSGEQDMARVLAQLNRVLYRNIMRIKEDKTMTLLMLHYRNREFSLVGQHESVIICRANGRLEVIDTIDLGFPVGLEDSIEAFIFTKRFQLQTGDLMALYTDGITEAENERGDLFEMNRLTAALLKYRHLEARQILDKIIADVYTFIGQTRVFDDISMLVIKQK